MRRPVGTGHGAIATRDVRLVRLSARGSGGASVIGLGEASPLPGFGLETIGEAEAALARALPLLLGRALPASALSISILLAELADVLDGAPAARAALELALCDAAARAADRRLADWLADGVAPRDAVPCNAILPGEAFEDALRAARRLGVDRFKLKVGKDPSQAGCAAEVARIRRLCAMLGEGEKLRLDANGALSEGAARALTEALSDAPIEWLEQPFPADRLEQAAALRRHTGLPIALDESASGETMLRRIIALDAADIVVIKPAAVGGPLGARRMAETAREAGLRVVVTSFMDSIVGVGGALHLAASLQPPIEACGLLTGARLERDRGPPRSAVDGALPLPAAPGLGVEPDLARAEPVGRWSTGHALAERPPDRWLEAAARRHPERLAVRCGARSLSYAELEVRAAALESALERSGLRAGDRAAVLMESDLDAVVLFHALCRARIVLVPLNLRLSPVEQAAQLAQAHPAALIHGRGALAERATALADGTAPLARFEISEGVLVCHRALESERSAAEPDPPLAILFTSGTGGRAKGAVLGPEAFTASALASERLLGLAPGDLWLACMPLFHVGGLSILIRSVLAGSGVLLMPRFDEAEASALLDREPVTMLSVVANMLQRLLDLRGARRAPPCLRAVLLGGGPAGTALMARAIRMGFPLAPTYGLTEAASQVATRRPEAPAPDLQSGLEALPGTRIEVVDESGSALAPGMVGEIRVAGSTLMRGYLDAPEQTAETLRDGWLHTGDVGVLDARGRLRVLDRRSDLIVSGGENVYPAEIEAVLEGHPDVAEAGVGAQADERFGARPIAYVVMRAGACFEPAALVEYCAARLARYKLPVRIERRDALPRNAAGKLSRRALY